MIHFFSPDAPQTSGGGGPGLPREGVPDNDQAAGTFVGRRDPPPVFADAEAGDHVRVTLRGGQSEGALRRRGCGRTEAPAGEAGAPGGAEPLSGPVWLEGPPPPACPAGPHSPHSPWAANLSLSMPEGCATPRQRTAASWGTRPVCDPAPGWGNEHVGHPLPPAPGNDPASLLSLGRRH